MPPTAADFPRFHAAPKQTHMRLYRPPAPSSVGHHGRTLVLVLTVLASIGMVLTRPETEAMPPPTPYEDCLAQNYDAPRLLVRCEDLLP